MGELDPMNQITVFLGPNLYSLPLILVAVVLAIRWAVIGDRVVGLLFTLAASIFFFQHLITLLPVESESWINVVSWCGPIGWMLIVGALIKLGQKEVPGTNGP